MTLFEKRDFVSAAGVPLTWRIECDALTDADWQAIADICGPKLPKFGGVLGVPRGGLALHEAMIRHMNPDSQRFLIVDDVWTTGYSMSQCAARGGLIAGVDWIGFVAFARGPLPPYVHAFMRSEGW